MALYALMASLAFLYGFSHPRWENIVDFMLEKDPGVPKIHRLRIIVLLKGDLQLILKVYFNHRLIPRAEKLGLLSKEQHGNCQVANDRLPPHQTSNIRHSLLAERGGGLQFNKRTGML